MKMAGIKESLELLEGVKLLALDAKAVLKDGKINLADLPILLAAISQFGALTAAIQGVNLILPEVKDLDQDEVNQLAGKVLEIVAVIKAA
jgi:hypothetical protein